MTKKVLRLNERFILREMKSEMKNHKLSILKKPIKTKLGSLSKYLWLIILLLVLLVCIIRQFPCNYSLLLKPGYVVPKGIITDTDGQFYESCMMFIEEPDTTKIINHVDGSNPKEVNAYLEKMESCRNTYHTKPYTPIHQIDRILPASSDGKERILVLGSEEEEENLLYRQGNFYLFDNQMNLLDRTEFEGKFVQYFISANFTDRLWIQVGDPGSGGYLYMHEIFIVNDKIEIKHLGYGADCEYHTYKIINHHTNPRMYLYRKAHYPLAYIIILLILFNFFIFVLGLFLISRKL